MFQFNVFKWELKTQAQWKYPLWGTIKLNLSLVLNNQHNVSVLQPIGIRKEPGHALRAAEEILAAFEHFNQEEIGAQRQWKEGNRVGV